LTNEVLGISFSKECSDTPQHGAAVSSLGHHTFVCCNSWWEVRGLVPTTESTESPTRFAALVFMRPRGGDSVSPANPAADLAGRQAGNNNNNNNNNNNITATEPIYQIISPRISATSISISTTIINLSLPFTQTIVTSVLSLE